MFDHKNANDLAKKIYKIEENYKGKDSNIYAILYRAEEEMLLAHAFKHNENFYGIAEVSVGKNLKTKKDILNEDKRDLNIYESFWAAPYAVKNRFCEVFGEMVEVYTDGENNFYSALDIIHGKSEIPEDILKKIHLYYEYNKVVKWKPFFVTKAALNLFESIMSASERKEWKINMENKSNNISKNIRNFMPTQENPVMVDLYGTDDLSFSKSFPNEEEAFKLLERIEKNGHQVVIEEMYLN